MFPERKTQKTIFSGRGKTYSSEDDTFFSTSLPTDAFSFRLKCLHYDYDQRSFNVNYLYYEKTFDLFGVLFRIYKNGMLFRRSVFFSLSCVGVGDSPAD